MKPVNPSILGGDPLLRRVWEQLGRPSGCAITGGHVRDRLLGRRSNDLDLTIDGTADEAADPARRLATALGVRAHLLGTAPHRVWRIETSTLKVEIWPLGELSQEEDIRRRDFSCNALRWELPYGPLVDLVGGVDDLERGRLRAVSRVNLESDPVRLLRAPRFLAQLEDFELDDLTRTWIRELAPSLAKAPRERVGQELLTLLQGPGVSRGLAVCLDLGLFGPVSPAADKIDENWLMTNLGAADKLTIGHHRADTARLALLIRAFGLPTDRELAPYAWPKTDRENALKAARLLDEARTTVDSGPADRRELAWRAGSAFPALEALASALNPVHSGWRRWRRQWQRNRAALEDPQVLLTGIEVATITGIELGPNLGEIVRALLRAQVRGEIRSRGGALRWLKARHLS